MYDVCVIGGGIVGKYIVSQLKKQNVIWISSDHPAYKSSGHYKLNAYLGRSDTWQEKATGLISWPTLSDLQQFPLGDKVWLRYVHELKEELHIQTLQSVAESNELLPTMRFLQRSFSEVSMQYFESAHQVFNGPSFAYREEYDQFWVTQKPIWTFLRQKPDYFHAEYFNLDRDTAFNLYGTYLNGKKGFIKARRFIIAGHVPGTLRLLKSTYRRHKVDRKYCDYVGKGFSEHPQLSFGFLALHQEISRTTLPAVCYQDYVFQGLNFRLEFHLAPPKKALVELCLKRFPQYTAEHFIKHFIRVVAVLHIPYSDDHRLNFLSGNNYEVSSAFYSLLENTRNVLLQYLQKEIFPKNRFLLLNRHFPWYFAGHMSGGLNYPFSVDNYFFLNGLRNVAVASSAVFPTSGLFNPSMTTLLCAKHILSHLKTSS